MTKKKILALTMALVLAVTLPLAVLAEVYDLAQGSITVEAREDGQYVSQAGGADNVKQTTETVIKQTDSDTTSTTNTITIKAEKDQTAQVTISDVNIDVSGTGNQANRVSGDAALPQVIHLRQHRQRQCHRQHKRHGKGKNLLFRHGWFLLLIRKKRFLYQSFDIIP